jgi:hypothetical protein
VTVVFEQCISTCAQNVETSCELQQEWGALRVISSASYDAAPPGDCNLACLVLSADCGEVAMTDAELLLVHGNDHHYFSAGQDGRCADSDDAETPRPRIVPFADPGTARICLGDADPISGSELVADEPFPVLLDLGLCLSSSCTEDFQADCEHIVDEDEITVSVQGSYGDRAFLEEGVCTEDCGVYVADCGEVVLPEGSYTITHGDQSHTFSIPSDEAGCL